MTIRIATHQVAIYRRTKGRGWRAHIQPELTIGGTTTTVTARTRKAARRKAIRYLDTVYPVERFVYPSSIPGKEPA